MNNFERNIAKLIEEVKRLDRDVVEDLLVSSLFAIYKGDADEAIKYIRSEENYYNNLS